MRDDDDMHLVMYPVMHPIMRLDHGPLIGLVIGLLMGLTLAHALNSRRLLPVAKPNRMKSWRWPIPSVN